MEFNAYEPLDGRTPDAFVARHPHGQFVALEVRGEGRSLEGQSLGIWDEQAHELIWMQHGGLVCAWLPSGMELVVVRVPEVGELQDEGRYVIERRLWPGDEVIGIGDFALPFSHGPDSLVVSPHGNLAVLRWITQGLSGWEFVALTGVDCIPISGAGLMVSSEVAISAQPAFSPDGRYVVTGYHTRFSSDARGDLYPQQRGRYEVGAITVVNVAAARYGEIVIDDAIPIKLHGTASRVLDTPVFLDRERFTTMLPTGAKRTFSVNDALWCE